MLDNVLQFYPTRPKNDLIDYYLALQKLEADILIYKDEESVSLGAKQEIHLARREQLKSYGMCAQRIIDWWAKVQAAEHKLAIEQGRVISIPVGKEYGKRLSKHKYEVKILYEHRRSFLPDTPENRALTSVEGFKSYCGETMVLMSAIDAGRPDPAIKKKIKKLSEGCSAKYLFLGKALILVELALAKCEKLIKASGEKCLTPDGLVRLERDISEFIQYSNYEFIHKDGRARARAHSLATRDARLREVVQMAFQDVLHQQNDLSDVQFDELFAECAEIEAIIYGLDDDRDLKQKSVKFKELLADEIRCKILDDYFVACGESYPDSYVGSSVEEITPIDSPNAMRSYIVAHLAARKKAKVALGLIYGAS
ncbi:hypothetical protein [Chromobacterium violaceum]|uniref:hypothetical protein n=1 Tax=Chromobacterium violaceum TaxID=536 RepID=UPI001B3337BE|nr:hypothetical protein [Chromobacterium violaceum]MBP4047751.1 hypothetical protein [Chromobacterium violaceum]